MTPFEIPEIIYYIGNFLDKKDLISCIFVSRDWYSAFIHFIWQDLTLQYSPLKPLNASCHSLPKIEHILSHSSHIQTLSILNQVPDEYYHLKNLYHLNTISVTLHFAGELPVTPLLANLIESHSSSLKEFRFFGHHHRQGSSLPPSIYHAIGLCQNLSHLYLKNVNFTAQDFKAFLVACASIGNVAKGQQDGDTTQKSQANGLETLRLVHIIFPEIDEDEFSTFAPLSSVQYFHTHQDFKEFTARRKVLALCPNVKSLCWRRMLKKEMSLLVSGVESGMWKHLDCLNLYGYEVDDESLSRIFRAQPSSLKKLNIGGTGFGEMAFEALISTERHYDHIQELDLLECPNVTSTMIQQIMMTMPALQRFSADRVYATDMFDDSIDGKLDNNDGGKWVCKNLRHLQLRIDMGITSDPQTAEYGERQRRIYSQLSELELLETLDMSTYRCLRVPKYEVRDLDFRIGTGFEFLAPLKRLRVFIFERGHIFTEKEIDWITSNWRSLRTMSRHLNISVRINSQLWEKLHRHNVNFALNK